MFFIGRVKKVFLSSSPPRERGGGDDTYTCVIMFARHVFCYRNISGTAAAAAAAAVPENSFVVVLDKPMCSAVCMLGDDTLLVGTVNGSIYFFSAMTGVAIQRHYIDIPFHFEILGIATLAGCDSVVLAWDHRTVYRFNLGELTTSPPFEMNMGRPMGIAGCGGLVCTLQDLGNVWLVNTVFRGHMRYFPPPSKIVYEEGEQEKHKITKLLTPTTYDYQAIWMNRKKIVILYPSGTTRIINLN